MSIQDSSLNLNDLSGICLNGVKGVLVDIDDTLYSYQNAHPEALESCFRELKRLTLFDEGFEVFQTTYTSFRNKVKRRLEPQGTCRSRLFAFQDLFESLGLENAYLKALEFEDLYWNSLIKNIELRDQFRAFFEICKENDVSICAVSDMQARFQIEKLRHLGILEDIKFLVTSEEVGIEKPNAAIFLHALDKLKMEPLEVIMIGDSYEKDVLGARALGIKAYLLEN